MKYTAALVLALALAGCAPLSISQSLIARPLLNETTVGGRDYPIVIEGAENVGLDPQTVARNLRFPHSLSAGGSFRAISLEAAPATYARLNIGAGQPLTKSTLTFIHGTRRIGLGTFSVAPQAYADPNALGSVSATLILDMLAEASNLRRDNDILLFRRF